MTNPPPIVSPARSFFIAVHLSARTVLLFHLQRISGSSSTNVSLSFLLTLRRFPAMSDRLRKPQLDCLAELKTHWPTISRHLFCVNVIPGDARKAIIFVEDLFHAHMVSGFLRERGVTCEIAEP
jgi:hypothetical protein